MAPKKRTSRPRRRSRSSRRSGNIAATGPRLLFETEIRWVFNEEEVVIRAIDGDLGERVGSIMLEETKRNQTYNVAQLEVAETYQRRGVATQLYEQAVAYAWQKRRYALASDVRLNRMSRAFWEKQMRLGRAQCTEVWGTDNDEDRPAGLCRQYVMQTPPPLSLR